MTNNTDINQLLIIKRLSRLLLNLITYLGATTRPLVQYFGIKTKVEASFGATL